MRKMDGYNELISDYLTWSLLKTLRSTTQEKYFTLIQERSQKGDSGCASEKLGVPHLLSD